MNISVKALATATLWLCILCNDASASENNVVIPLSWGALYGTLTTPAQAGDTAAIIIAGSGPTDRNGNSPKLGLTTNGYLYLAQALEKAGVATLSYDKRYIGASRVEGDYAPLFSDYTDDAAACVEYLRKAGYKRIVLIGHSEGSLIALCVAQSDPTIAGIVSLAGSGYPLDQALKTQLGAKLVMSDVGAIFKVNAIIDEIKAGKEPTDVPSTLQFIFGNAQNNRYLYSAMQHNPQSIIRTLKMPILIINGDRDLQISVDNAEQLKNAQPKAKLMIIKDMSHTLKTTSSNDMQEQMMSVYMNGDSPLNAEMERAVVDFITTL